ncbi:MAG: DUF481 domain-containing protein [Xanthomonadales bacterium]|nr:DUF481 domain-containing protein [Xanthomonadales bacterium]
MMRQISSVSSAALLGLLLATGAQAEDESGWSGKGAVGVVAQRGNSETETISISAELINNLEQWRHTLGLNTLNASDDGVDTADRLEIYGKTDYKISDTSFWFASLRYEDDEFSQFDSQATLAAGYGRQLLKRENHVLTGEVGLGYRRAELRASGETETDPILRGTLAYRWDISETAALTNNLLVEAGSDNTFAKNVTAITADIANNFGIQFAYEVRHNTEVDDPAENSDFVTTVNLVYSIK